MILIDIMQILKRLIFNSILDRIQNNYDIGLMLQDKYYSIMETSGGILKINNLPLEVHYRDLYNDKLLQYQVEIYVIKKNNKFVCSCGCTTLVNLLELIVGDDWEKNFNKSSINYTEFLNNVFIPSSCKSITLDEQSTNKIQVKNSDIINATLSEKIDGASIEIPYDELIVVNGYFKKDPLNIHKKFDVLSRKFKEIISKTENIDISNHFVEGYLNQMTTRDLVILSVDKILRKIQRDHGYLNKLKPSYFHH